MSRDTTLDPKGFESGTRGPDTRACEAPVPAFWARAASDEAAFAHEQAALGQLWTFLGVTEDVAEDGQWFRTDLGGRSIFVQRFGDEIRGFENKCAHRFYPLRTEDRGKGAVVCGFHHWRYNKDGLALGIPACDTAYGTFPKAMDARLALVEIATLGGLVFGRFRSEAHCESLEAFLGDAAPILATLCPADMKPKRMTRTIGANWKFLTHISLDDYHIVAVHPSTFGKLGYLDPEIVTYGRFGLHSMYTTVTGGDPVASIVAECRSGTYEPLDYVIVNLFPSLGASQFHAIKLFGRPYFFVLVFRYVGLAPGKTRMDAWFLKGPGHPPRSGFMGLVDRVTEKLVSLAVPFYTRQVVREDNHICEGLQSMAREMESAQRLSPAYEARVGWFEEAYADVVGPDPEAGVGPSALPNEPATITSFGPGRVRAVS